MVIPQRILMSTPILLVFKFFQRAIMAMCLQKIDHSSADDTVGELKYLRCLLFAIRYEMKMVWHDHVSED